MTGTTPKARAACRVEGLGVVLEGRGLDVVDEIDLELEAGRIVGLVGESGSGKTTVGTALLAYARTGAVIDAGTIDIEGTDILAEHPDEVRRMRGQRVAYMPQDPATALDPGMRIGDQIVEVLALRGIGTPQERRERAREGLAEVGLPTDEQFWRRYPHQLSGGQIQRVALAMVFLPRPRVLVLDEPTTGLDVTTQEMVLETVRQLCLQHGVAALYVTHDLAVIAQVADAVAVMYAGRIVEQGPTAEVFAQPRHPYTRALLDAIPHLTQARLLTGIPGNTPGPGRRPAGCAFHDRCEHAQPPCADQVPQPRRVGADHVVRCLRTDEIGGWDINRGLVPDTVHTDADLVLTVEGLTAAYGRTTVLHDVDLSVARSEVLAIVGESGSGKTTLSRCIGGLHESWSGTLELDGVQLAPRARRRTREQRQAIQYIFQNPYGALNPRASIEEIIRRPMEFFGLASGRQARERVVRLLESVSLGADVLRLRTDRLSGGERQRVAIARALAARPKLLVCDEITSALDVSVQGSIVDLLLRLRREHGIAMVFVTHNLALVRSIADRVVILQGGRVVERGMVAQVLDHPQMDYTRDLIAATPHLP